MKKTNHEVPQSGTLGSGFTLMEILIAVAIIAVLSVIAITSYQSINKRARDARRRSDLEQVRAALEMYRTDQGFYPPENTGGIMGDAVSLTADLVNTADPNKKYIPSIPTDPKSTASSPVPYYYTTLGSGPPYYGYCVCGSVESDAGKNDCGITPIANCNYYLRNP